MSNGTLVPHTTIPKTIERAGVLFAVHEQGEMTIIVCHSLDSLSWAAMLDHIEELRRNEDIAGEQKLFVWLDRFLRYGEKVNVPFKNSTYMVDGTDNVFWSISEVTFEFPRCSACDVIKIACPV